MLLWLACLCSMVGGFNLSGCHDKADYLSEIRGLVAQRRNVPVIVGLGDGKNDVEMLKKADISCVIPRENGSYLNLGRDISATIIAPRAAPWVG